nr:MAG: nonstructural protein [Microvirus sp.]
MTKVVCCAVFDSAIQAFGQPIFVQAVGAGIRSFRDEVNRKAEDNQFYNHPDDFELRALACFDNETGVFSQYEDGPTVLARGKDVKESA